MTSTEAAQRLEAVGQGHLVAHAATLDADVGVAFLERAAAYPWEALREAAAAEGPGAPPALRPPVGLMWKRQQAEGGLRDRLATLGKRLIANGRVATLLLAGGEGTRLGVAGPKGNVRFGPTEDRTLYRILVERIVAASRGAKRPVPLYVLVSRKTRAATEAAFEASDGFGLGMANVHIIEQGTLPALDLEGRAILAGPGELALAPDGHGGVHLALRAHGVLADLAAQGIDVLTTFQVDNPLGRPLDPVMLGWMLERRADIVTKVVRKATPEERVGVLARDIRGRTRLVEYSELPEEGGDDLVLGSIAIHAFSVPWLHALLESGYDLPLHRARKKVPTWTPERGRVEADEPNAHKLERFLFDVFPEAPRVEVHEVARAWEFAPVKNAEGVDSLVSSRELVETELRRWHRAKGLAPVEPLALEPLVLDGP